MAIKHVLSYAELQELIRSGTPVIIDFFATWCGPCRAIAPKFEALSAAHPSVNFIKVLFSFDDYMFFPFCFPIVM